MSEKQLCDWMAICEIIVNESISCSNSETLQNGVITVSER